MKSARIYAEAAKFLGLKEVAGPDSHPIIKGWINQSASWLNPDDSETAWCGCFRGAIGRSTSTTAPKEFFRAKSWTTWGVEVPLGTPKLWQQGDTVIMARPGGNHVCLLDRVEGKYAYCLGGNQNNEVNITRFPLSKITHVRR
jgi:uncharacterized protein (TIGR02594 family)